MQVNGEFEEVLSCIGRPEAIVFWSCPILPLTLELCLARPENYGLPPTAGSLDQPHAGAGGIQRVRIPCKCCHLHE